PLHSTAPRSTLFPYTTLFRSRRAPRTAVLSTGDELVEITATPESHQIRRSNSYALSAALRQLGITASLHHLPDREDALRDGLARSEEHTSELQSRENLVCRLL